MIFNSISRTRKNKQFSFQTRYYNEEKEELRQRYNEIEAEITGKSSGNYAFTGFKNKWLRNKKTTNFEKKSNVRLAFIVIILFALFYWLLYV